MSSKAFKRGEKDVEDLEDEPRRGRPSTFDEGELKRLVEEDPKVTIRELVVQMNSSFGTVQRHLHSIGFVNKFGQWVPHQLSQKNKEDRIQIATDLLQRHEQGQLSLDSIVTGDEKWVLYVNVVRRSQWVKRGETPSPTAKAGLHPKKCLLSLFWDTEISIWNSSCRKMNLSTGYNKSVSCTCGSDIKLDKREAGRKYGKWHCPKRSCRKKKGFLVLHGFRRLSG